MQQFQTQRLIFSDTRLQIFHLLPLENLFDLSPPRVYLGLFSNQELSRDFEIGEDGDGWMGVHSRVGVRVRWWDEGGFWGGLLVNLDSLLR